MKTITSELKAKIFAQYLGCEMLHNSEIRPEHIYEINYSDDYSKYELLLKPLSEISDEDAIKIAMYRYKDPKYMTFLNIGKSIIREYLIRGLHDNNEIFCLELFEIDYLRSKGYALPYLDYSVDDLVELGVYELPH